MEERFDYDNMMRGTNLQIILLVSYTKYGFGDKKGVSNQEYYLHPLGI